MRFTCIYQSWGCPSWVTQYGASCGECQVKQTEDTYAQTNDPLTLRKKKGRSPGRAAAYLSVEEYCSNYEGFGCVDKNMRRPHVVGFEGQTCGVCVVSTPGEFWLAHSLTLTEQQREPW